MISLKMSRPRGRCSASRRCEGRVLLGGEGVAVPPTSSNSLGDWRERSAVPLKSRCSRKCEARLARLSRRRAGPPKGDRYRWTSAMASVTSRIPLPRNQSGSPSSPASGNVGVNGSRATRSSSARAFPAPGSGTEVAGRRPTRPRRLSKEAESTSARRGAGAGRSSRSRFVHCARLGHALRGHWLRGWSRTGWGFMPLEVGQ